MITQECFICHATEQISIWENVGICEIDLDILKAPEIRRNHAIKVFGLKTREIKAFMISNKITDSSSDKITDSSSDNRFPLYDTQKIIDYAKNKYGSIYEMVTQRVKIIESIRIKTLAQLESPGTIHRKILDSIFQD